MSKVIVLALALLDEVGELRGQKLGRHVEQSDAFLRSKLSIRVRLSSIQLTSP